jgi:cullin-4
MKPSQEPFNNSGSNSSKADSKRKPPELQQQASFSKASRKSPTSSSPKNGRESTPAAKRLKTASSSENFSRPEIMNKTVGIVTRPAFVDLTRGPSNFQPHAGAKKLVIKNLRTTSRADLQEYYEKTWRDVDEGLTAIFKKEEPRVPLEVLCRGVEATCRHGKAENLFLHLKDRCKTYLEKLMLPILEKEAAGTNVDALRAVWRFWSLWNKQSVRVLKSIPFQKGWLIYRSDSNTLYLQLPRSIIPAHNQRCTAIRRSGN